MADHDLLLLARRLALVLPRREREAFEVLQVRLARVLSRLWGTYAELLEVHASLTSGGQRRGPVQSGDFRPGDTLSIGASLVRTDSRLVLAERMNTTAWADLISDLAAGVLQAPDLARQELLTVFAELDPSLLDDLQRRFSPDEEDTDEFPAQPRSEGA